METKIRFSTRDNKYERKISEADFSMLEKYRNILVETLKQEELFNQIVESHLEMKDKLYRFSLRSFKHDHDDFVQSHLIRSELNRSLFNTLNLSKLYLDRHFHEENKKSYIRKISSDESLVEKSYTLSKTLHKENISYRIATKLRNYVQHSSLPIHNYVYGASRKNLNRTIFYIPLDKDFLIKKIKIASKDRSLIQRQTDLHLIMDKFIEHISEIHIHDREIASPYVEKSKIALTEEKQSVLDKYDDARFFELIKTDNNITVKFSLEFSWYAVAEHIQNTYKDRINFYDSIHNPYMDDVPTYDNY